VLAVLEVFIEEEMLHFPYAFVFYLKIVTVIISVSILLQFSYVVNRSAF